MIWGIIKFCKQTDEWIYGWHDEYTYVPCNECTMTVDIYIPYSSIGILYSAAIILLINMHICTYAHMHNSQKYIKINLKLNLYDTLIDLFGPPNFL